jgi:hypothetical protein
MPVGGLRTIGGHPEPGWGSIGHNPLRSIKERFRFRGDESLVDFSFVTGNAIQHADSRS